MLVSSHQENLRESLQEIERAIKTGLVEKQRTLGFHASAAAMDMVEIIFHQHRLIDPGFVVKHEWFHSPRKVAQKFPFDFPRKQEMIKMRETASPRHKWRGFKRGGFSTTHF